MSYLNKPIGCLQDFDFNAKGELINKDIDKNKTVIIMIQSNFCGYCTMAKPAFQKFAENNKDVVCLTIQGDGSHPGEKELNDRIKIIDPTFRGYPSYVAYKNGKYVKTNEVGRSETDLRKFANSV